MLHMISVWVIVAAFGGAGLFNMIGTAGNRAGFVRWGYPSWWCHLTGALEIGCAVLIALPATRMAGLVFGAAIIAVAVATVLRFREFGHLVPLGVFAVLLALPALSA